MSVISDNKVRQFLIVCLSLAGLGGCGGQLVTEAESRPILEQEAPIREASELAEAEPDSARRVATIPGRIRYVVQEGDSLWSIASRFLYDPWRWREVWQGNPGLDDPDRIYPGDTLSLQQKDGVTRISVTQRALPVYKLSPRVRTEELKLEAVPTVNKLVLDKFIVQARIVDAASLKQLPYVLGGAERRLLGGTRGDEIYVMGLKPGDETLYGIYKRAGKVRDGQGRIIGEQLIKVAEARLLRQGKPSQFRITRSQDVAKKGDVLLPLGSRSDFQFVPRPAPRDRNGRIISVFGGINMIGQFNSVTLDLGLRDGIEPGHVLGVFQKRGRHRDPVSGDWIRGYDRRAGILIVYKSYDKVSHALVMDAHHPLRVDDVVGRP